VAKIAFVQDIWSEYLGVMYLSAVLKKAGHECCAILGKDDEIIKRLQDINPDVIAFSSMTLQHEWVCEMAKKIRKKDISSKILIGGPHTTFFPEDMINKKGVDAICIGEGEDAILEYVNAIANGTDETQIKNLWIKKNGKIFKNEMRPLVEELDSIPFPDRKLYMEFPYFKKKQFTVFITSRGCPYRCSFCFNHAFQKAMQGKGRFVRFRNPDKVIEEIKQAHKICPIKTVMFIDSTFNLNKKWMIEFLRKYKEEIDLPFSCNVRADLVDEDVVKAIANTGNCVNIRFAIETGDEKLRNELLQKQITDDQIMKAVALFKKYKVPLVVFNMFGLPGETLEQAWKTIKMNRKINPLVTSNYVFAPLPGLEITDLALSRGYMTKNDLEKLSRSPYKIHRSVLKQKQIKEVENLQKFSVLAVRFPWMTPLIKVLIKLPRSKIFDMVYNFTQVIEWRRWMNVSYGRLIMEILKNYSKFG